MVKGSQKKDLNQEILEGTGDHMVSNQPFVERRFHTIDFDCVLHCTPVISALQIHFLQRCHQELIPASPHVAPASQFTLSFSNQLWRVLLVIRLICLLVRGDERNHLVSL